MQKAHNHNRPTKGGGVVPLFGVVHLSLLVAIVGAAATLSWLCRRRTLSARTVRLVLGGGIAANELVWWVFRYSHEGIHSTNLPLQLCNIAVWLTVVACLTLNPLAVELAYFAGLAGSGMAVLTPDLWKPWPSYPAVYFFLAHGGVLVACSALIFGKIVELRRGAVWRAFGIIAAYAAAVGIFNAVFGANYMYLCSKPVNPSLLNWLGPWPWYLGGSAAAALVLFWVLWLPVRPARRCG
jgi:hypothetical integral membrane protein (TIGR02206 family)